MNGDPVSLYECQNAHVPDATIQCRAGHKLSRRGAVWALRIQRGDTLMFAVCQGCPDFDRNGPPIQDSERGWRQT
ncbi:MAG: hypothetical protein P3T54_00265 [Dehalogenimonas sp.]|nr:hypothetical protein [Dehalogenimonas sp.]